MLTGSEACLYDFDARGFWYVIFLHNDRLGMARRRHEAGHHLMLLSGDLLFSRSASGRDEAIDIMGRTFSLRSGMVFLVTVTSKQTSIVQARARARRLRRHRSRRPRRCVGGLSSDDDAVGSVLVGRRPGQHPER